MMRGKGRAQRLLLAGISHSRGKRHCRGGGARNPGRKHREVQFYCGLWDRSCPDSRGRSGRGD